MSPGKRGLPRGVAFALGSALLFGLSTPAAKRLLGDVHPVLLAGLLYGGSGVGLFVFRLVRGTPSQAALTRHDAPWLAGAVLFGGILGPVLLLLGLRGTPASTASLLLNLEVVFTALLAWFVFHENFDRRIASGMALIVGGGVVLSWPAGGGVGFPLARPAIAAACLCWAIDNNLTQRVSGGDPVQVAAIKGGVSSAVNLAAAAVLGASWPCATWGTARTGAYFSVAPFVGAVVSLTLLGESLGPGLALATLLMGVGVWLHLTELHEHEHRHEPLTHTHHHAHDEHHGHAHSALEARERAARARARPRAAHLPAPALPGHPSPPRARRQLTWDRLHRAT